MLFIWVIHQNSSLEKLEDVNIVSSRLVTQQFDMSLQLLGFFWGSSRALFVHKVLPKGLGPGT